MVFIIFMIIAGGIRADQCIRHVDGSTSTSRYEDEWVLHALCTWVDTEEVLCMFIVGFITHTKMRPCIVSKEKEYMFMNWANERMLQRWHIYTKLKLSFVINQRRLCDCATTVSGTLYTADPSVQIHAISVLFPWHFKRYLGLLAIKSPHFCAQLVSDQIVFRHVLSFRCCERCPICFASKFIFSFKKFFSPLCQANYFLFPE